MWLLAKEVESAIRAAISAGMQPTVEQEAAYEARCFSANSGDTPRLLTVAGDKSEISVQGVITKAPSLMAMLFGGGNTTYAEINAAIAAAEQDPEVKEIIFRVDSPGGQFDGLFETLAAIEGAKKPTKSVVSNKAASAAFALVSQTDEIIAANRAASFGSVGIVVEMRLDENKVAITSTEAPKKRPDVSTEEGKAVIREELDAVHQIFAESIAEGRGTTVEKVNKDFGQGATMLAAEALKNGMIDGIADTPLKVVKTPAATSGGKTKEVKVMDSSTLKTQHPAVHEAVVQEGATAAVAKERDRVNAFLVAGEQSGDMKTALDAIKDGSEMTATLSTSFLMAAANRGAIAAKDGDDASAADGAKGGDDADEGATASDAAVAAVEANLGTKVEV